MEIQEQKIDEANFEAAKALLDDREWRLNNLYYIEDKYGKVGLFKLNDAQCDLLDNIHDLNIILKARQLGFSTFILIFALDCCLFNSYFDAGLVADTIDNAKGLLRRIKFAYERINPEIKKVVQITTDNAEEIRFSNHSGVEVGVSLRSSTKNLLHVSEYGKICAKQPEKAKEIKSGSLNTLAKGQFGFIESTAEGRSGDFYKKTEEARKILEAGRKPVEMEWGFHFYGWFWDPDYTTTAEVHHTEEEEKYLFDLKDEHGIELTEGQKAWYTLKAREQGDDMMKEYPSTPEEAFKAAKDGAYFAKDLSKLRQRKKIGVFEFSSVFAVHTFWDFGVNDSTTIWLMQVINGKFRFVGYYENSGEGIAFYLNWLDKWQTRHSAVWGRHYGPHDIDQRKQGEQVFTIKSVAKKLGYTFQTVTRTPDKLNSIQSVRTRLPDCEFDEAGCAEGILHLENYSKEWDEKLGSFKSYPLHDEHSHGADGFMTFADGFIVPKKSTRKFEPEVVA